MKSGASNEKYKNKGSFDAMEYYYEKMKRPYTVTVDLYVEHK
jgi:hypothetical protein